MKIYCEKCKKEISKLTDSSFEQYAVGRVKCPHCNTVQKRYISEADILLFFAVNETIYAVISIITMIIFQLIGVNLWIIIPIILLLVIYYFISKELSRRIYTYAYKKEAVKDKVFDEDVKQIKKNFTWQFMLFFALAITFVTQTDALTVGVFFFILVAAIVINYVKFFLQARNERNSIKKID